MPPSNTGIIHILTPASITGDCSRRWNLLAVDEDEGTTVSPAEDLTDGLHDHAHDFVVEAELGQGLGVGHAGPDLEGHGSHVATDEGGKVLPGVGSSTA